ncbi:laccase [Taiwanofungus camphoratus]|nr:laccase [Antrodia cinnamomea]KAI0924190.1 laccase [Antrodia cinnamomea]
MANSKFFSAIAVTAFTFSGGAFAQLGPIATLPIFNRNIAPDGFSRAAVLAGGTFPGPVISGNKGDNFQINVLNQLTNETMLKATSVHWHGISQHGSNWADGTATVTQCPIAPGNSFLYNFNIPDQAGTYWYHSHNGLQYCDGLRGPFIVYDPNDPQKHLYDIDDESTIITLADWYHVAAKNVPVPPTASSVLINGLGRDSNTSTSPLSVITVIPGLRYRFRLISMSCDPNFVFSIDGHNMTIIEAEGENTEPLLIDSVQIFAAQRYSFVLEADQPINNYWIRAVPDTAPATPNGLAILRYVGAPLLEPTTKQIASSNSLLETNLHPLTNPAAPGGNDLNGADVNINLNFTSAHGVFFVNGVQYIPPPLPVLLQILNGSYSAQDLLPAGSVYTLPRNKTIQVTMPALAFAGPHPMHLHGHTFSVIRSAGSSTYNYDNPIRRDTVNTGTTGDEVTVRFNTNNPGPWFFHCHIDFHLALGFAIVFAEDPQDTPSVDAPPPAWDTLCPIYDALPSDDQ